MSNAKTQHFLSCLDKLVESINAIVKASPKSLYPYALMRKIGNFKIEPITPESFPFTPSPSQFVFNNRIATVGLGLAGGELIPEHKEDAIQSQLKEHGLDHGPIYFFDIASYLMADLYVSAPSAHSIMKAQQDQVIPMICLLKQADDSAREMIKAWHEIPLIGKSSSFGMEFHVQEGINTTKIKTLVMIDGCILSNNHSNNPEIYTKTRRVFCDFLTSMEIVEQDASTLWMIVRPPSNMKVRLAQTTYATHNVLAGNAREAKMYYRVLSYYRNAYHKTKSAMTLEDIESSISDLLCMQFEKME